jgi:guanylate kinase
MIRGNLYIVSAPSGAGKTSLVRALLDAHVGVRLSVSYTTRAPRPGEVDGRDYHFVSRDAFLAMRCAGEFLESAEVYGNLYGTSETWIRGAQAGGDDVLLEIDWQGAAQVRRVFPDAVTIFIAPPSIATLENRLKGRAQDAPEVIARRLSAAREDMSHAAEFAYIIVNDVFEDAVKDLTAVVRAERLRGARQAIRHAALFNTFN